MMPNSAQIKRRQALSTEAGRQQDRFLSTLLPVVMLALRPQSLAPMGQSNTWPVLTQPHQASRHALLHRYAVPPSPRLICGETLRAHKHACGPEEAISWARAPHLSGDGDGGIDGVGDDKQHGLGARLGARCHEVANLDKMSEPSNQRCARAMAAAHGHRAWSSLRCKTVGAHNGSVGVEEVVARHAPAERPQE